MSNQILRRRPAGQQMMMPQQQKNKMAPGICVQGFRSAIAATSTTPVTISLNASPQKLVGISLMPASGTLADIADTQITFIVNNLNLLLTVAAQSLCPNYFQGFLYYPFDQKLRGNDTIIMQVQKNNAGAITLLSNIFYLS